MIWGDLGYPYFRKPPYLCSYEVLSVREKTTPLYWSHSGGSGKCSLTWAVETIQFTTVPGHTWGILGVQFHISGCMTVIIVGVIYIIIHSIFLWVITTAISINNPYCTPK